MNIIKKFVIIVIIIISSAMVGIFLYDKYQQAQSMIIPVEEFVAKLNNSSGNGHVYVKLNFSLEARNHHDFKIIQQNMSIIRNITYQYLYSLNENDLNTGSAIYFLQEGITLRINKVLNPIHVNNILLNNLIVG